MTRMTWEEFSQAFDEAFAELGITVLPETEPPTTTTFNAIMKQRRAETPDSSRRMIASLWLGEWKSICVRFASGIL